MIFDRVQMIAGVVLAVAVGVYIWHAETTKARYATFVAETHALGAAAEQDRSDAIKEGIARQEKANADLKNLRTRNSATARQLHDERARSRALSAAAASSSGSDRACLDRAGLLGAIGRLDAGLSDLARDADTERDTLNAAKRWAQDATD